MAGTSVSGLVAVVTGPASGIAYGVTEGYHAAEMRKTAEIAGPIEAAARALGGGHGLVNTAGIPFTALMESFTSDKWGAVMAINQSAAFCVMQAPSRVMKQAGSAAAMTGAKLPIDGRWVA
jgi:3-hydroxybutyrate dehydrogenase